MRVSGHAGAEQLGKDIVCASVSMLTAMLAEMVLEAQDRGWLEYEPECELQPGYSRIACVPKRKHKREIEYLFEGVCTGYEMLAQNYPGNVVIDAGIYPLQ